MAIAVFIQTNLNKSNINDNITQVVAEYVSNMKKKLEFIVAIKSQHKKVIINITHINILQKC